MPDVAFDNLLIICALAVVAPLIVGFRPGLRVPAVVLEIVGGIIIGPSALGWVHIDLPVQILALVGLAFLLFLAGLEIDLRRLRGQVLAVSVIGYAVTLVLGLGAGAAFHALGWVDQPLLLAVALSATSLGLVVPVLKDAGQVDGTIGQRAIAAATVADFAAIVLLSLFFSSSGGTTGSKLVLLSAFAALVLATAMAVLSAGRGRDWASSWFAFRTAPPRSGCVSPLCCSSRSRHWPSGSAWRASWVPSWRARSWALSTGTPRRTPTSASSSRRSDTAS